MSDKMLWMKNVREVTPYTAGEQPKGDNIIKLNTNENPYPPSPMVKTAYDNQSTDVFNLYPELSSKSLSDAIADYHSVSRDEVFVGVGSDDVLSVAFLTFFNSEKPILFPDITYSFYPVWAQVYGIPYENIPLNEDFKVEKEGYFRDNGGIVIANPNAPTSISMPLSDVKSIIENNRDVVVIIDEAYVDFGGETALGLVSEFDNLLVVRTYSKSRSMAGMRIGYAIGNKALIDSMKNVKESINSYTINTESITLGKASLKDEEYFCKTVNAIVKTREETVKGLEQLGFEVLDSSANFLFAKHERVSAKEIFEELKRRNIFVRYFNKPRIDNYLRITIGTEGQMKVFMDNLKEIVG